MSHNIWADSSTAPKHQHFKYELQQISLETAQDLHKKNVPMFYGTTSSRYAYPVNSAPRDSKYGDYYIHKQNQMRTPQQALKDAINSGAVQHWIGGGTIQFKELTDMEWFNLPQGTAHFTSPKLIWRTKPEPTPVPFTQRTVPKNALWRFVQNRPELFTDSNSWRVPTEYHLNHISFDEMLFSYRDAMRLLEYSIDGGTTWLPAHNTATPQLNRAT
jgi:hypothetical protein